MKSLQPCTEFSGCVSEKKRGYFRIQTYEEKSFQEKDSAVFTERKVIWRYCQAKCFVSVFQSQTQTHTHTSKYWWLELSCVWRSKRRRLEDEISTQSRGLEGKKMEEQSIWRLRKWPAQEEAGRRTVLIKQVMGKVKAWVPIWLFTLDNVFSIEVPITESA